MTACGNKESETVTPDNSTTPEAVETQPTQEATGTEETTSRDDTGVYPNATGLTEVAMGVTEDICTFKVPLNYVLAGGYYDENNEEHTIQGLNSATTTVEGSTGSRKLLYWQSSGFLYNDFSGCRSDHDYYWHVHAGYHVMG